MSSGGEDDSPPVVDATRERLIDAAERCFERYGVAKTTVEDIAGAADVSRATVYRYFDRGRDEVVLGVILREAERFLEQINREIAETEHLEDALVTGLLFTLRTVRASPTLALLFDPEVAGATGAIVGASDALLDLIRQYLAPQLERAQAQGRLRDDLDLDGAAEFLLRTILSLLTVEVPVARDERQMADFIRTYVSPAFVPDWARDRL